VREDFRHATVECLGEDKRRCSTCCKLVCGIGSGGSSKKGGSSSGSKGGRLTPRGSKGTLVVPAGKRTI